MPALAKLLQSFGAERRVNAASCLNAESCVKACFYACAYTAGFFSSVRKTMTGNNPKLDLVNVDARKKRLVRFCQFILKILSGNEILTSIKGRNSLKIYRKITGNNPKLDIVNVDVHTKFGLILSICSQDIERKRNSDVNQGP